MTSAHFYDFLSLPPPVGSFLLLSVSKFGQFLTPPPKKCRRLKWMVPWVKICHRPSLQIKQGRTEGVQGNPVIESG